MRKISLVISYLFLFLISCIDEYKVPNISYDAGILVIDGFINTIGTASIIKISRSAPLLYSVKRPELKAKVTVEGDDNSTITLADQGSGTYSSILNINPKLKYRMRVKTLAGKEYLSDFVEVKQTPAIDSVTFQVDESRNGLEIQVNSHDPKNIARNYVWEYVETWIYYAECPSLGPIQTFTCWRSESSGKILSFSTKRLTKDVVSHVPITFIPANSPKQYSTYSILVKQYAVTDGAMGYLQQLKKNTEQLGSLFDAFPSPLTGNFHSLSDPNEPVVGYLQIQNVTEKRIFIRHIQLPSWFKQRPSRLDCYDPDPPYLCTGDGDCADCRFGGGVIVRPDFWIN